MLDPRKPFIEFCCMGHETYFTEEFQSDEDDSIVTYDPKKSYPLSFMPGPYEDSLSELKSSRFSEESSVQCETQSKIPLSSYAYMPAISCDAKDKVIIPNPLPYSLSHTPRVFFPEVKIEKFNCRHCGVSFKNSQALGGHISRKH